MPQQYEQFEESGRDESPFPPYQDGYPVETMPGQKIVDQQRTASKDDADKRLGLMIVSIVFLLVAMALPFSFTTVFFTLLFTLVMVGLNLIFNPRR